MNSYTKNDFSERKHHITRNLYRSCDGIRFNLESDILLLAKIVVIASRTKNMTKTKIVGIVGVVSFLAPYLAFAESLSTSTVSTQTGNFIADVGAVLGSNIPTILGLLAALAGLGWVIRKFSKHVTGKKF